MPAPHRMRLFSERTWPSVPGLAVAGSGDSECRGKERFFLIRTMSKPLSADAALRPPHFSQTVSCQEKEEPLPAAEGEEKDQGSCAAGQAWLLRAPRGAPATAASAGGRWPAAQGGHSLLLQLPGSHLPGPAGELCPCRPSMPHSFFSFFLETIVLDFVNRQNIHMAQVPTAVKRLLPHSHYPICLPGVASVTCFLPVLPEIFSACSRHTLHTALHVAVFTQQCHGGAHSVSGHGRLLLSFWSSIIVHGREGSQVT